MTTRFTLVASLVALLISPLSAAEPFGDWRVEATRDKYNDKETIYAATYATKTNADQKPVFAFACGDGLGPKGTIGITFVWQNNGPIQEPRITLAARGGTENFDVGVLGTRKDGVGIKPPDYERLTYFVAMNTTFDLSARMSWGTLTATFSTRGMKEAYHRLADACGMNAAPSEVPAQITCPPGSTLVPGSNPPTCRR